MVLVVVEWSKSKLQLKLASCVVNRVNLNRPDSNLFRYTLSSPQCVD